MISKIGAQQSFGSIHLSDKGKQNLEECQKALDRNFVFKPYPEMDLDKMREYYLDWGKEYTIKEGKKDTFIIGNTGFDQEKYMFKAIKTIDPDAKIVPDYKYYDTSILDYYYEINPNPKKIDPKYIKHCIDEGWLEYDRVYKNLKKYMEDMTESDAGQLLDKHIESGLFEKDSWPDEILYGE